ncbi:diphosphomevalonate decarboxylase [Candidatus Uabimicrobium amorphum]|uniref:diphosphomevalonate decarboxylase n=1 Tax=Uabimicrobium amorphum TaxID=2596890 RepID=A0A5S9IN46_UABAM|nr:diphosphomevalonate decarboxylase [Candidatus Uabimicrobium amorphum]BBM84382.1 diphosphomevalonate decarboxylase [Candidatus Uabimicrobium amorphum]
MYIATYTASANIAVVKYWGKRNEELILPYNNSLSFTMDDNLQTITTVMFSEKFSQDELWLNGKKMDLQKGKKSHVLPVDLLRKKADIDLPVRIVSKNCFPTGAGFASSASGVAALVCATSKALNLTLSGKELSMLARQGSGSASRSVYGGFVEWLKGDLEDGTDSFAQQIAPHDHWPELRNVIAVVETEEKKVSSRHGMKTTTLTSALYEKRLQYLEGVIPKMKEAVLQKDFATFAELTMRESNSMHASMLDTWPPIMYLSDGSREVIYMVEDLNAELGKTVAGYTFDAGPNAHIYTTEEYESVIKERLEKIAHVKNIEVCKVGQGPQQISDEAQFLIDPQNGEPRL